MTDNLDAGSGRLARAHAAVSVVIPTKDEAAWLPRLLHSVHDTLPGAEIIVSDFNSTDATRTVARDGGCVIVNGGRPARGRNAGAAASTEELIVFADADCVLNPRAIAAGIEAINEGADCVHFRTVPLTSSWITLVIHSILYCYIDIAWRLGVPQGVGPVILVRREAYERVGGFNERIGVGEDADFIRRVAAFGRVTYLDDHPMFVSARRFAVENPLLFSAKCLVWGLLRLVNSDRSIFQYKWFRYDPSMVEKEAAFIRGMAGR